VSQDQLLGIDLIGGQAPLLCIDAIGGQAPLLGIGLIGGQAPPLGIGLIGGQAPPLRELGDTRWMVAPVLDMLFSLNEVVFSNESPRAQCPAVWYGWGVAPATAVDDADDPLGRRHSRGAGSLKFLERPSCSATAGSRW
jgi:hypothetical protein